MRKIFSTFLALLLVTGIIGIVNAGYLLRQNDDGTSDWVNQDSDDFRIGRVYLTLNITDVGAPSTAMISVPFAGTIALVDAVVNAEVTGSTETLTVSIMSVASPGDQFVAITTNNTITLASTIVDTTGKIVLGGSGDRSTSGNMAGKSTDQSTNEQLTGAPTVSAGGTIVITSSGTSSSIADATIIIYFDRDDSAATFR
jgi:hypothetical protein